MLSLKMSSPPGSISPTPRDTSADLVALNERLSTLEQALAAAQQTHQPHHRESYIYCPPCPALTHTAYNSLQPTITTYKILPRSAPYYILPCYNILPRPALCPLYAHSMPALLYNALLYNILPCSALYAHSMPALCPPLCSIMYCSIIYRPTLPAPCPLYAHSMPTALLYNVLLYNIPPYSALYARSMPTLCPLYAHRSAL